MQVRKKPFCYWKVDKQEFQSLKSGPAGNSVLWVPNIIFPMQNMQFHFITKKETLKPIF